MVFSLIWLVNSLECSKYASKLALQHDQQDSVQGLFDSGIPSPSVNFDRTMVKSLALPVCLIVFIFSCLSLRTHPNEF